MIKATFEMNKFLRSRPALANNNQNEVTAVISDSDTDSNNDVVVEISLNSSCEVEQVSQDQGNDASTDDIEPSTTGSDYNPWPYFKRILHLYRIFKRILHLYRIFRRILHLF